MSKKQETMFICSHCTKVVQTIGTSNRNHCPHCLWGKHLDESTAGDRASTCHSDMVPIGLTFKKVGLDKWGKPKQGELMVIHRCVMCEKISINRIAADDDAEEILGLYKRSVNEKVLHDELEKQGIDLLKKSEELEVRRQLFGN